MSEPRGWRGLDNAAKIFPPTSNARDSRVFRFACELYDPVDTEVLQASLDKTLELFPFYLSVIKKGFFWHYLEDSDLKPAISEENRHPCSALYNINQKNLLFSVTYYRTRINLEVYHVLSDGTGAIQFFRTMLVYYLQDKYRDELGGGELKLDYDAAQSERDNDSFSKYFSREKILQKVSLKKAYQIKGDKQPLGQLNIIEGRLSTAEVKAASKHRGATITEFLTAVLVAAIGEGVELRYRKRPVTIAVPVNLRQYFPSMSARNFFGLINVSCQLGEKIDFSDILNQVQEGFAEQLKEENVRHRMNRLAALEHNMVMKVVPLALKDPILGTSSWIAEGQVTAGLSNVGRIVLPAQLEKYIRLIDVFNSTNKLQVLLSSFGESFMVDFTSVFTSTDIQRRFFRFLTDLGMTCEISTNWVDEMGD